MLVRSENTEHPKGAGMVIDPIGIISAADIDRLRKIRVSLRHAG